MKPRITTWTESENAYLRSACGNRSIPNSAWRSIADGMGTKRTPAGCKQQMHKLRRAGRGVVPKPRKPRRRKVEIIADMQEPLAPHQTPQHVSPIAAMLGEPPLGRSALDQMRAGLA